MWQSDKIRLGAEDYLKMSEPTKIPNEQLYATASAGNPNKRIDDENDEIIFILNDLIEAGKDGKTISFPALKILAIRERKAA
jgi:hypothetical protein